MTQLFQDSLCIVRKCGKPDLFLTFTANPDWPEIQVELLPHQTVQDRPDIVARVFHQKLQDLLNVLKKKKVFGRVVADIHVVEYQKR